MLSEELGCTAILKFESHLPTCAFKIRGGIHLLAGLSHAERRRGLVTATRGNHGQSIALASTLHGASSTIFVPRGNNPEKNTAMRAFGARVVEVGRDFDEARAEAERLVEAEGKLYVPITEPRLVLGVGSLALELFEQAGGPLDAVICGIGVGTLASSLIIVRDELSPSTEVVGVQAARAPAVHDAWKTGTIEMSASADTMADGLASRTAFPNTLSILRRGLADCVLVSESEIEDGVRRAMRTTHTVAEGAAAAAYAAAWKLRDGLRGKRVAIVHSGANLASADLARILGGSR